MSEPSANGFRDPFRYISLALLGIVLVVVTANFFAMRAAESNSIQALTEVGRLTTAVNAMVISTDIQSYLLALPQEQRPRLNMPPALWNRIQKGEDFLGDPSQRRRPDRNPRLPGTTLPGDRG